jgi:hypothetical protein
MPQVTLGCPDRGQGPTEARRFDPGGRTTITEGGLGLGPLLRRRNDDRLERRFDLR